MTSPSCVLAIGAHPDDIELGCGGSLAKLAQAGVKVHALVLTRGTIGATSAFDRPSESHAALRSLGVARIHQCDLPDTGLDRCIPSVISAIEAVCGAISPQRIYTMFEDDRHQDHRAIFQASIIACRGIPQVLCYETPSSWPNFAPRVYEEIGVQLEQKLHALSQHHSQQHRDYMQHEQIRCSARFRGQQVGLGPSEGFIPYRMVL
ncbi:PIG-L deacetylase family protein [Stenotrophomonas sp.]|uniref:PIG-L deacetylase family protein n=1 Tax=Stenotrophomonas sp. TaxID=69392 RepID=UPI0028B1240B|nr:PIG-L deacetylase family protein [Stenotrophomonas sp.]